MKHPDLEKWTDAAWTVQAPLKKLPVPHRVFTMEAVVAARFVGHHWEPVSASDARGPRPGLRSAVGGGAFGPEIGDEILELVGAFNAAHMAYRLAIAPVRAFPVDEAEALLRILRDTLGWYFEQVDSGLGRAQLRKLKKLHAGARSHDAIAAALYNYAALAEMHEAELVGLLEFTETTVEDARRMGWALRAHPPGNESLEDADRIATCLELRNRVATLLHDRVRRVRTAARLVFKRHPEIVRQVTSDYERQRQAKRRGGRAARAGGNPQPCTATLDEVMP